MANNLSMVFKKYISNSQKVLKKIERVYRGKLILLGVRVQRYSRKTIHRKKGSSPIGTPPHTHSKVFKPSVLYAVDDSRKSVVIGPIPFPHGGGPKSLIALEYGGRVDVKRGIKRVSGTITIIARPYMNPAMTKILPDWLKSLKGII